VVSAAVSLLDVLLLVRVDVELAVPLVLLESVVEELSLSVVELESVAVLEAPLLVPVAVPEVPAGSEEVPSAPATVKPGAKLKLLGFSSSVMRIVYSWPA
jgi:hypothetical protein